MNSTLPRQLCDHLLAVPDTLPIDTNFPRAVSADIQLKVSDADLSTMLTMDMHSLSIQSAQWFRVASLYYPVTFGYNSALCIGSLHGEFELLKQAKAEIVSLIRRRAFLFFGIGIGDSEAQLVDYAFESNSLVELTLVDINLEFLQVFINSIKNRSLDYPKSNLSCCAIQGLFEQLTLQDIQVRGGHHSERVFACLGSTIGNYETTEGAFKIFDGLMRNGDSLILTYQTDVHIEVAYRRYSQSPAYRSLIGNFLLPEQRSRITWNLDRKRKCVEAWLGEIELFRSRKFTVEEVKMAAARFGMREEFCSLDRHRNLCLHIFVKRRAT